MPARPPGDNNNFANCKATNPRTQDRVLGRYAASVNYPLGKLQGKVLPPSARMCTVAASLPASLRERLRAPNVIAGALPAPRASGSHVLYILRTAHRCEGNPSLEVALRMAAALELPLRCVAVVEDSFPPSSRKGQSWRPTDRAAAFRLEALRELQPAFTARGTELLVHVERDGCRAAVCMSLAARAALVVIDEHYGVEPHAAAAARAAQAKCCRLQHMPPPTDRAAASDTPSTAYGCRRARRSGCATPRAPCRRCC